MLNSFMCIYLSIHVYKVFIYTEVETSSFGFIKYNLSDVHGLANSDSEAVTVPKVNVEVDSVHVLLQVESVIQMFAEIAGSGKLLLF